MLLSQESPHCWEISVNSHPTLGTSHTGGWWEQGLGCPPRDPSFLSHVRLTSPSMTHFHPCPPTVGCESGSLEGQELQKTAVQHLKTLFTHQRYIEPFSGQHLPGIQLNRSLQLLRDLHNSHEWPHSNDLNFLRFQKPHPDEMERENRGRVCPGGSEHSQGSSTFSWQHTDTRQ